MSDFKQAVEEIENTSELKISHELSKSGWCKENKNCVKYRNCTNCIKQWKIDRILAAHNARLDEIAEGLPKDYIEVNTFADVFSYNQGAIGQRCLDKAHVKAQKEAL